MHRKNSKQRRKDAKPDRRATGKNSLANFAPAVIVKELVHQTAGILNSDDVEILCLGALDNVEPEFISLIHRLLELGFGQGNSFSIPIAGTGLHFDESRNFA
jgi:hypothetical protein